MLYGVCRWECILTVLSQVQPASIRRFLAETFQLMDEGDSGKAKDTSERPDRP
jgi:hypothetical protein